VSARPRFGGDLFTCAMGCKVRPYANHLSSCQKYHLHVLPWRAWRTDRAITACNNPMKNQEDKAHITTSKKIRARAGKFTLRPVSKRALTGCSPVYIRGDWEPEPTGTWLGGPTA